jgi:hypothetical protein
MEYEVEIWNSYEQAKEYLEKIVKKREIVLLDEEFEPMSQEWQKMLDPIRKAVRDLDFKIVKVEVADPEKLKRANGALFDLLELRQENDNFKGKIKISTRFSEGNIGYIFDTDLKTDWFQEVGLKKL